MTMPATLDLTHYRGDTLGILINCWKDTAHQQPADLTGATITAEIRVKANTGEPVGAFIVTTGTPEGGTVMNQIMLVLPGDPQRGMPAKTVWDCQIDWTPDGLRTQTPVKGNLTLTDDVTQTVADDGLVNP